MLVRRYDAAVYGYVSTYLESNFFPSGFPIGVWLGYASTFLLRPVGGVTVGRLADRYMSRGQASLLAIGAMTVATVLQVKESTRVDGGAIDCSPYTCIFTHTGVTFARLRLLPPPP